MPFLLIATAGAADANSYATVDEADLYHEGRLYKTAWTAAVLADKEAALVWATKLLDSKVMWAEWPTNPAQPLAFPRVGLITRNQQEWVPDNVIPQEIKDATAELARQLIVADRTADSDIETLGITSLRVGPVSMEFKDSVRLKVLPDSIWTLIPRWWRVTVRSANTRDVVRA